MMTTAYWCVLAASILPLFLGFSAQLQGLNLNVLRRTRARAQSFDGWKQRAYFAQLNGWENFPGFAAAVIIAHVLEVPQPTIDMLALGFIGFRVIHAFAYIADRAVLRFLFWAGGMTCMIALYVYAA